MPMAVAAVAVAVALVSAPALVRALQDGSDRSSADKGGTTNRPSPEASPQPPGTDGPDTANDTANDGGSADDQPSGDDLTGNWVAQLASTEKSAGDDARRDEATALRGKGITNARYLDSDEHASLQPGYWMFYVSGFNSGSHAVAWCRTRGLDSDNTCVGRYISDEAADRTYLCRPAPDGGTTGRCERD